MPVEAVPGEGAPWLVELRFSGTVAVEPVAPTFTPGEGAAGTVGVPDVEGVEYRVDDVPVGPGEHAAAGAVTVTAGAFDGYVVVGDATWSHTFVAVAATPDETVERRPGAVAAGAGSRGGPAGDRSSGAGDDAPPVAAAGPQEPARNAPLDPLTLLVGGLVLGGLLLLRGRRDQIA
ncbi:hypothetical protein [Cellulosimicrobium sp. CUA-896]|uniref:hypothetical protein n=1 Tax=Cellulosimicrobium sp. CUA-896 TaxID=1517881 RepID=UPI000958EAC1|nr:hypothetical protein [Cellulosimicrobium sp. CUA-896]OLT54247.1 hypothetical protein BJF88_09920 [Cellulosimicrobium sp. CUA-896]